MRGVHIDSVDHVPRPIIAIGTQYPDGHFIAPHQHRRGQLISSASGVIVLGTPEGTWVMPPQRGMWIPPATAHSVRMVGAVSMQSLYVEPDAVPSMPTHCQVVGISPFMRSLLTEALNLPLEYELEGRAGALMAAYPARDAANAGAAAVAAISGARAVGETLPAVRAAAAHP